jgi:hypothetical protein
MGQKFGVRTDQTFAVEAAAGGDGFEDPRLDPFMGQASGDGTGYYGFADAGVGAGNEQPSSGGKFQLWFHADKINQAGLLRKKNCY